VLPGPYAFRRVCLHCIVRSYPLTAPFLGLTSVCLPAPHSACCSAHGGARGRGVSCPSLGPRNHACVNARVRVGLAFPEGCRALDDPFPEVSSGLSPVRPSARPGTRGGVLRPVRRASHAGVGTGARAFRCVVPRAPCLGRGVGTCARAFRCLAPYAPCLGRGALVLVRSGVLCPVRRASRARIGTLGDMRRVLPLCSARCPLRRCAPSFTLAAWWCR
jgi:hypothetical protein